MLQQQNTKESLMMRREALTILKQSKGSLVHLTTSFGLSDHDLRALHS
ncbi:hypothetical protein SynBIOSE41_02063 [Synechococcus sp. BIOS-E4-1]|nr:hypothetical protein SynBIOSE41_02063 [Synechococcus sp. BIOS-E4-1]